MNALFIDLASHGSSTLTASSGLLACASEKATVAVSAIDHRIDDRELIAQVEDLLSRADWKYQDLTQIACVIGPGGFTSLRVAVALANTLSSQLKIPSAGIHLSDLYHARISDVRHQTSDSKESDICNLKSNVSFVWLHSTKKNELFIRDFTKDFSEPTLITISQLRELKGGDWTGELILEHQAIIPGWKAIELKKLEVVLPAFLASREYNQQILLPWYGRGW